MYNIYRHRVNYTYKEKCFIDLWVNLMYDLDLDEWWWPWDVVMFLTLKMCGDLDWSDDLDLRGDLDVDLHGDLDLFYTKGRGECYEYDENVLEP